MSLQSGWHYRNSDWRQSLCYWLLRSLAVLEGSSFPGLGSQMLHTDVGDDTLSSVTASHFSTGLMNHFQSLEEPENSTVSLLSAAWKSILFFTWIICRLCYNFRNNLFSVLSVLWKFCYRKACNIGKTVFCSWSIKVEWKYKTTLAVRTVRLILFWELLLIYLTRPVMENSFSAT